MCFGLIGANVAHSYSKRIHEQFGYEYRLWSLTEQELGLFMQEKRFRGINVTIPYKQAVLPYCDALSDAARRIGCVNTIIKRNDGSLFGDNTDYAGLKALIACLGVDLEGKKVVILGAGGTSLTALAVAEDAGAKEIVRISRRGEHTYENISRHFDADVLINTTPVGMFPNSAQSPLSLEGFARLQGVVDVIYSPLRTRLCQQADRLGIPAIGGLYMLVAQAARAAERFTGRRIGESEVEAVYRGLAMEKRNIMLIGMPGSGKSALGRLLAERLNRPLVDMDKWVEDKSGKSIPEIFAREGEAAFRALEREAAAALGALTGQIISTGGGAVLCEENMLNLRQNGRIYFIQRELSLLDRSGRPLSKDEDAVARLYAERLPLYQRYADKIISNNAALSNAADAIEEDFYEAAGD